MVRANIGIAKIEGLEKTLGMKGNDYNVALMVFFVPYVLCGTVLTASTLPVPSPFPFHS